MKRLAVLAMVIPLVAGCASAPPREAPQLDVDVPAVWSLDADTTGETSARWWREFGDEALDTVIEEALRKNYNLRGAVARVDQAAALAGITRADRLPNVSAGGSATRQKQNLIGIAIPGAPDIITSRSNTFGVSLDASWEIDLWGRVRTATSAAVADMQASQADLAGARVSIAAQTAKAWFAVTEARLQVQLAEATVANYESSAGRVRERYQSGVRTSLDLRLALASLANSRDILEQRRQQLDLVTRQLEMLLGRYPSASIAAADALPEVSGTVPRGMPSELLIRRPDLFAAERRFAAAEARVSSARRAFFPRITLTGSTGTLTDELESVADGDFSVWRIAAGITQPIFQGGRLIANLQQSNAASDIALANYASTLLSAFGEVESALFAESSLAERERHLSEAAAQAEAARELAQKQYNSGLIDYITLLETQRQALSSRSQLIAVKRARLDARVNLHVAVGGGFNLEDDWARFLEPRPEQNNGGSP